MEDLNEKTLTPNEAAKKEEIVKSLKKKQGDFVKRYGVDRAKGVMYATATKVAKAVTEETTDEGVGKLIGATALALALGIGASQFDKPELVSKKQTISKNAPTSGSIKRPTFSGFTNKTNESDEELDEDAAQKLMSNAMDTIDPAKRNAARATYKKARSIGLSHAASLNTMVNRHMKNEEADSFDALKQIQREHLLQTGELLNMSDIIREAEGLPDGRKVGPIEAASKAHGRVKKTPAAVTAKIAAILSKTK